METYFAIILFVVLAAKGEECPEEKTVGEICYQLLEKGIDNSQYGCQDGCVYTTGNGEGRFCFKQGLLPVLDTCPAKNQTQDYMNERLILLETTTEVLLDMAKRSVYQLRPKEQIMDCQNDCMMDETIETFKEYQTCSQTCITGFTGPFGGPNQTHACEVAGAPLKGRCVPRNNPIPPKIKAIKTLENDPSGERLCKGTDECAIYRWQCNTTANIKACKENDPTAYLSLPFPGTFVTFYYLPPHQGFPGVCNSTGTGETGCGCIGKGCTCDCTCLSFYRPI